MNALMEIWETIKDIRDVRRARDMNTGYMEMVDMLRDKYPDIDINDVNMDYSAWDLNVYPTPAERITVDREAGTVKTAITDYGEVRACQPKGSYTIHWGDYVGCVVDKEQYAIVYSFDAQTGKAATRRRLTRDILLNDKGRYIMLDSTKVYLQEP